MGDGADMALEEMEDTEDAILDYKTGRMDQGEAFERGLIDERGTEYWTMRPKKEYGPGACPKCGGATRIQTGSYGKFYGCLKFPECTGSLSYRK